MQSKCLLIIATCAAITYYPAFAESNKTIKTERGADVEVLEDIPSGPGPFPVVILAPGVGYHARLPLLDQLSKSLAANGVAVFRFDWAYYTKDGSRGKRSVDFSAEVQDMKAVLEAARSHSQIDKARIVLAGKSLGSIITWKLLQSSPDARGGVLLTPVCSRVSKDSPTPAPKAEINYPELAFEKRPLLMVSGENDPLCSTPILYRYAGLSGGPLRVSVIGGNHALESGDKKDSAFTKQNAANIDLAVQISTDFIKALVR
jgi:hypothetical protein